MWSNQVSHQSGGGKEDKKDKLDNKVMEVYVGVEMNIALCRIHVKPNT